MKEKLRGGKADNMSTKDIAKKHKVPIKKIQKQIKKGAEIEKEHTNNKSKAKEIAKDHAVESPKYYNELEKMEKKFETKESTTNSSNKNTKKPFKKPPQKGGKHPIKTKTKNKIKIHKAVEDSDYYNKFKKTKKKLEPKESTSASAAGAYEAPASGKMPVVKRPKINKIPNFKSEELDEVTDASVSAAGAYDAPFPGLGKNNMGLGGENSIRNSMAVKKKNFPKFGGPEGTYVKIKDKCKKYPYCNQGDINSIEILKEAIEETSKKYKLPKNVIEELVITELNKILT